MSNQSYLSYTMDGINYPIIRAEIMEKMNNAYTGAFYIRSDNPISHEQVIEKKASLLMTANHIQKAFHFIITSVNQTDGKNGIYMIAGESPLRILKNTIRSRSFANINTLELIKRILTEKAFGIDATLFQLTGHDKQYQYIEQQQCSDFVFLERILKEQNLLYYFKTDNEKASICIQDQGYHNEAINVISYPILEEGVHEKGVFHLNPFQEKHDPDLQAETKISSCNIPTLNPGTLFETQGDGQRYCVISSQHTWDESAHVDGERQSQARYQNVMSVVACNTSVNAQYIVPATDHIHTALTVAKIKGNHANPKLGKNGEYYVQPSDMDEVQSQGAIHTPVPKIQPLIGQGSGMHFPLQDKVEVLMARINGHPDHPIILGALYNESHQNPVTAYNASQNIIKTAAGSMLIMDDSPIYSRITLSTAERENELILSADKKNPGIQVHSQTGGFKLNATHFIQMTCKGSALFDVQKECRMTSQSITLSCANNMSFKTSQNMHALSKGAVTIHVGADCLIETKGNFMHHVKKDFQMSCQKNINITTQSGNINVSINKENLSILANKGPITFTVGNTTLEINNDGIITVKANKVVLRGKEVNMREVGRIKIVN